jgi:ribosomal-protein-alanine N-acetyltransferase
VRLAACHGASWPRPWSTDAFAALLADPAQALWCADGADGSRDAVIGFVAFQLAGADADLTMVAVLPDARRTGLGQALVETGLTEMAAAGVESVFLEVAETNASARALYARLGFREAGQRRSYYPATPDDPGHALVLRWSHPGGPA